MKTLKLSILCVLLALFAFTSCENDDSLVDKPDIEESPSITRALDELSSRFSPDGSLNPEKNVTNNIVFDFCFNFVYPIDLSYNTGAVITVNSLDDLIDVMINSTEELYINGINFPFDVEVFNESTNAIEIATITNEDEFISLIENCDFDGGDPVCTDDYDPVCVEILDQEGNPFILTYPNACWAELEGFTENDFVDCEDNVGGGMGNECFEFNYPLSIIVGNNSEVIEITSDEEFQLALYGEYLWDFVYPFSVTLLEDDSVVQVNNGEEFVALIIACFNDNPEFECSPDDLSDLLVACNSWFIIISGVEVEYSFANDGTMTVIENNNILASGTWEINVDNLGSTSVIINTNSDNFSDVWTFLSCNDNGIIVSSSNTTSPIFPGC